MQNKKGQLGYEYIILIGMVLVLVIPFFYSFFVVGFQGGLGAQANQDMVTRVALATKTVSYLGGPGTRMDVVGKIKSSVKNNMECGNKVSITTSSGEEFYVKGAPRICSSVRTLTGGGLQYVPVTRTYGGVVVGSGPAIVMVCRGSVEPENAEYVGSYLCGTIGQIETAEDFKVIGANLVEGTQIYMTRLTNKWKEPEILPDCCADPFLCEAMEVTICGGDMDCGSGEICNDRCFCSSEMNIEQLYLEGEGTHLLLGVGNQQTGVGTYAVQLVGPQGDRSKTIRILMVPPGQVGFAVCGNGELEEGEECDDGNNENGDGCSADCVIEIPSNPDCGELCQSSPCGEYEWTSLCLIEDDGCAVQDVAGESCAAGQWCECVSSEPPEPPPV